MKTTVVFTALMLMGCPVAVAYEHPELPDCVIDRCENDLCTIETPEGTVEVPKKRHYFTSKQSHKNQSKKITSCMFPMIIKPVEAKPFKPAY